jgi:inorganic pyrophosphatase
MGLDRVPSGNALPNDFNVIIEIPMHSDPVKYEVDKDSGQVFVDRFMSTAMHYPCNYGYIPHTIAGDGDPVDVLVVSQFALPPGVVVRCRPIGMLAMEDEAGPDGKLLAVPVDSLTVDVSRYRITARLPADHPRPDCALLRPLQGPRTWQVCQRSPAGWAVDEAKKEIMEGRAAIQRQCQGQSPNF